MIGINRNTVVKPLVIGQVVSTSLYNLGRGVIYAIHGQQSPETVKHLFNGILASGGNASFDIAFENGSITRQLPESILLGVQWKVYNDVINADDVLKLYKNAITTEDKKLKEIQQEKELYQSEIERLKHCDEYGYLDQEKTGVNQVTTNIRKELKKHFPAVKFSVRKRGYDSVSISWTDGPKQDAVSTIVDKYKEGHFDGMEDMYKFNPSPFNRVYGGVQYVSSQREFSDALTQKAIDKFVENYGNDFDMDINLANYNRGALLHRGTEQFSSFHGLQSEITRIRSELTA